MPSLGSQDHIEDAVDSLQKGPFQYLLITGTHTDCTRLDSSLDAEGRENLLEHYRRNPIND